MIEEAAVLVVGDQEQGLVPLRACDDGLHRCTIGQTQNHHIGCADQFTDIRTGRCAGGYYFAKFVRAAIPDVHLMAAGKHTAYEAGAHQAGGVEGGKADQHQAHVRNG